jgi:hypothetical protein
MEAFLHRWLAWWRNSSVKWLAAAAVIAAASSSSAQTKAPSGKRSAAAPPARQKIAADMSCPSTLGIGVTTKSTYCDVMTEREPEKGILITLPPHKGPVTLTFDLHNRHTYSEEQVKANRAYAKYTATVGVLTMDNTLISRATVQNEFRQAADLVERIGGGAGPGGVKAVAPTGTEPISITIPEAEQKVSILGEKLIAERLEGSATYASAGRPIALINNVMVDFQPRPAAPPARKRSRG